jgi:hypothetical protein
MIDFQTKTKTNTEKIQKGELQNTLKEKQTHNLWDTNTKYMRYKHIIYEIQTH